MWNPVAGIKTPISNSGVKGLKTKFFQSGGEKFFFREENTLSKINWATQKGGLGLYEGTTPGSNKFSPFFGGNIVVPRFFLERKSFKNRCFRGVKKRRLSAGGEISHGGVIQIRGGCFSKKKTARCCELPPPAEILHPPPAKKSRAPTEKRGRSSLKNSSLPPGCAPRLG